jgi:hypothetical protein
MSTPDRDPSSTSQGDRVPDTAMLEPAVETNNERAVRIYWSRSPWRYDARFHVLPHHVHHVPVFLEPPETPYGREVREAMP